MTISVDGDVKLYSTGLPQALENMKNGKKKFHALKSHGK